MSNNGVANHISKQFDDELEDVSDDGEDGHTAAHTGQQNPGQTGRAGEGRHCPAGETGH